MNVIDLISSVEDILIEGQLPILKTKSLVDVDELLDMLDEMKRLMPQELQAANHLRAEKNKLIIEAQLEAQKLLEDVAKEADKMVSENDITQNAYIKSKQIMLETKDEVNELKREGEVYLADKFGQTARSIQDVNSEAARMDEELKKYLLGGKQRAMTAEEAAAFKKNIYEYISASLDELITSNNELCRELLAQRAALLGVEGWDNET
ncbi:MAG: hypothetical protein J6L92_01090 [Clostridia bacterium]|nr:hypothetical protein [Clostridia bacterium]